MAETPIIVQPNPDAAHAPVEKVSRFKNFTVNHPRTAKVVGIVALTAGVLTVVNVVKNRTEELDTPELDSLDNTIVDHSSETTRN